MALAVSLLSMDAPSASGCAMVAAMGDFAE